MATLVWSKRSSSVTRSLERRGHIYLRLDSAERLLDADLVCRGTGDA